MSFDFNGEPILQEQLEALKELEGVLLEKLKLSDNLKYNNSVIIQDNRVIKVRCCCSEDSGPINIPESIKYLRDLRYLEVDFRGHLTNFESIRYLENLETLRVINADLDIIMGTIEELPN
ncbi:MAG: hypothetical protein ACTSWR_10480, partial [Candidatus Helarchaeota archaeon]